MLKPFSRQKSCLVSLGPALFTYIYKHIFSLSVCMFITQTMIIENVYVVYIVFFLRTGESIEWIWENNISVNDRSRFYCIHFVTWKMSLYCLLQLPPLTPSSIRCVLFKWSEVISDLIMYSWYWSFEPDFRYRFRYTMRGGRGV